MLIGSLRLANVVPDVTENWCLQAWHFHSLRVVMKECVRPPQRGQTGSPPVSHQRIMRKASWASPSLMRATLARLSVRAARERRKC